MSADLDAVLREHAPRALAAMLRRHGDLDLSEDCVQEALIAAGRQWPEQGIPDSPAAWLHTVATRRYIDVVRAERARRERERTFVLGAPPAELDRAADDPDPAARDDSLTLLVLCCHPALTAPSQLALTLRAVGGLTTAEIAAALLAPETTIAQRISRAKKRISDAGARFERPTATDHRARMTVVAHVLYLMFTEGHTATTGESLVRTDLAAEAIRLTREVLTVLPDDGEIAGLLALMLLTNARRAARTDPNGLPIPLADQDRTLWDRSMIAEGTALLTTALSGAPLGPYQLQAAIAAVHDEAEAADDTDWRQIVGLYDLLEQISPNPMARLSRAIAVGQATNPETGLRALDSLATDPVLATHHRLHAARAHLLTQAGNHTEAAKNYRTAARLATSETERNYLMTRATSINNQAPTPPQINQPQTNPST